MPEPASNVDTRRSIAPGILPIPRGPLPVAPPAPVTPIDSERENERRQPPPRRERRRGPPSEHHHVDEYADDSNARH